MARRPDTDTQAQALLFAAVHGDEAACKRFKLSDRSLRRYRELVRDEDSELAETVRRYAEALDPERKAVDFAGWLLGQVRETSALFLEKAAKADVRNPEALRAVNEHVGTLLDHKAALDYLDRLFGAGDEPGEQPPAGEGDE